jgi:hypothetical protein
MHKDRLDNAFTTILINLGFLFSAALCIILGLGFLKAKGQISDIDSVARLLAAALATFVTAIGASLFLLRRRMTDKQTDEGKIYDDLKDALNQVIPNLDKLIVTRDELPPFAQALNQHNKMSMAGMALRTITTDHLPNIRRFVQRGGTARFILVQPGAPCCDVIARSFFSGKTSAAYSRDVRESLDELSGLQEAYPDRLEIRVLDYVPATSITLFDDSRPTARMVLEFYTYATSSGRPHLNLTPPNSPTWYHYFVEEFEVIWRKSTPWYRTQ